MGVNTKNSYVEILKNASNRGRKHYKQSEVGQKIKTKIHRKECWGRTYE